jgi:23S rRNA pseudouridine1911/1915/1917 synthase
MNTPSLFIIPEALHHARVDKALATLCPELSRTRIKALIEQHAVLCNNSLLTDVSLKVVTGDMVAITIPEIIESTLQAQDIPLDIVFEDAHLLVINKQAGLVVHPAAGNPDNTLVNALLAHCGDSLLGIGGEKRPGLVHRLDKDTTGLMVVAKTEQAHHLLAAQLQDRTMSRTYHALIWQHILPYNGDIVGDIGRHPIHRQKMAVVSRNGKEALTYYHTFELFKHCSLVECKLATGRTHQIRVHLSHKGHPVVGDAVYSRQQRGKQLVEDVTLKALKNFPRQALHAYQLTFVHPVSQQEMTFNAPLPADFQALLDTVRG